VEQEVGALKDWLQEQAPDLDVPVRGVLVFNRAQLALDDPPVPAMAPKQIKGWLRKVGKLPPLSKKTFSRLNQALDEAIQVEEEQEGA
jgi:hypothetical protein